MVVVSPDRQKRIYSFRRMYRRAAGVYPLQMCNVEHHGYVRNSSDLEKGLFQDINRFLTEMAMYYL